MQPSDATTSGWSRSPRGATAVRPRRRPPDPWPGEWAPLGATPDAGGTNFALWSPSANAVDLCLFDETGYEHRLRLQDATFGIHHGYVPGVGPGALYGYRVHGPWNPLRGARWNPAKLLLDPYAKAVTGDLVLDDAIFGHVKGHDDTIRDERDSAPFVPRGVVVDDSFDWGTGDAADRRPMVPWHDTVLYEAHVRGFTMLHPAIPEPLRGTYAGLAHPAAVQHLLDLGVTTVELLPVHEFTSEEHLVRNGLTNYWGYNSLGFFAPHGGYSASGTRGQQVTEFKQMVKVLHAAGLEVVLDVVYNHTAEGNELGPTLSFRGIENPAYYRLRDSRFYTDYTGCGNTLDVRDAHVLQLIMDSLRYWVTQMHVDGFRFDLASALARSMHDVDMLSGFLTTVQQDPVLSRVKLIAEPWDVGEGGYQVGEFPPLWTEWNDKFRDTVRDFWRGAGGGVRELGYRLSGSSDLYRDDGRRPYSSINYITAHDGFCLRDLVSYDRKHNEANGEHNGDGSETNRSWNCGVEGETTDLAVRKLRLRQSRNLLATLLLATGVPMLVAGDEMGRTQGGNNNAYCQDNPTSWLNWELSADDRELLAFTRMLVRLRREHPVFGQPHFFEGLTSKGGGRKDVGWFRHDGCELTEADWFSPHVWSLGMFLAGDQIRGRDARGEPVEDDSFFLFFNAHAEPIDVTLPSEPWAQRYAEVFDTGFPHEAPGTDHKAGSVIVANPRTAILLRVVEPRAAHRGGLRAEAATEDGRWRSPTR